MALRGDDAKRRDNARVAERRGWRRDSRSDIWRHPSGAEISGNALEYHHRQHIEIVLCNLERRQDGRMAINPNTTYSGSGMIGSTAATANTTVGIGGLIPTPAYGTPQYEHYEYKVCGHVHNYLAGAAIPPECPVCAKQERDREENIKKLAAERKRKQDEAAAVAREPIAWLDAQVELVCAEGRP